MYFWRSDFNSRSAIGRWLACGLGLVLGGALAQAEEPPAATNLWAFPIFKHFAQNSSLSAPALAPDGTLYLGSLDGTFFAVTPEGKEKWFYKTGVEIKSSPAIAADGTIYFGSRDRNFYALTPAGKLKWKFTTAAWVDASPAIAADGTVYFGGWDGQFYALRPDGSVKWKHTVGAIVDASPAIAADGTIYFGAHDKKFYALNPDGSVRWTFATGGAILSSPAIGADGTVYFTSLDGNLYALTAQGTEWWHCHTGSTTESSPVLDEAGNVLIGLNDRFLFVTREGQRGWHSGAPVPENGSALVVPGRYYYSVPWATLQGVEAPDRRMWVATFTQTMWASPVMDDRGIIYASNERFLYAVRPPGELLPVAKSAWPMFRGNPRHTGRAGDLH
jgi:hypothetical protein